jgi:hypothetical protein
MRKQTAPRPQLPVPPRDWLWFVGYGQRRRKVRR